MCMSLKTCDILWVFMLICSSDWRTRHCSLLCSSLSVEKITSAIATSWLCFQDVRQRFIISRKRLKVFILKTSSERVSVCVQSCGSVPAEKAAASTPRRWAAAAPSTRLWGPLQIGFVCSRGKAVPQDQGNALSWLIQGQGGFIPSNSVLELRDRNENGNLIHQRCVP